MNHLLSFCLFFAVLISLARGSLLDKYSTSPIIQESAESNLSDVFNFMRNKILKPKDFPLRNKTQAADDFLEWYILELKSFVSESKVEFYEFERSKDSLGLDLLMISRLVQRNIPYNKALLSKLEIAKLMFMKLTNAIFQMKSMVDLDIHIRFFLHKIIRINCLTLGLQDSHGHLDISIKDGQKRLTHLWNEIATCVSKFEKLTEVPVDIIFMFENQSHEAKMALNSLVDLASNSEKTGVN